MADKPLIQVQSNEAAVDLKGSSWLSYNGLLLTDVLTESYEMQEQRTADGAQVLCKQHTIKVTAIINPAINAYRATQNTGGFPVRQEVPLAGINQNIMLIRDQLMQDRKALTWAIGGTVVLDSPRFNPDNLNVRMLCDSMQGPKPLYCQVTHIAGTSSYYVRFGIETWVDDCVAARRHTKAHRFSMTHDVDGDTWLTTRQVQGQVIFHPEWLEAVKAGQNPGGGAEFPGQILPRWIHPVPNGFKRQNVKIQAHPNGMELAYSFVDTEQTLPLGTLSPATKLTAEFSLSSSLGAEKAALTQAAVHITAVGPKNQYRSNLLIMAIRLANRKIQKNGHVMTTDIVITYSLDNTMVDLTMKALWKPVGMGGEGMQLNMTGLGAIEDYDDIDLAFAPFRANGEATQGMGSLSAEAPHLRFKETMGTYSGFVLGSEIVNGCYNASIDQKNQLWLGDSNGKTQSDQEGPSGGGGDFSQIMNEDGSTIPFELVVTSIFTITPLSTGLSNEASGGTGLYEQWEMDTDYRTSHQKAVMPIGSPQTTPSPGLITYTPPQVASLGLPYTLKVVNWTVAWIGPNPLGIILPSPDTGDSNDVLLEEHCTPAVPSIANSTNKCWRISGTYWYLSKKLRTTSTDAKSQYDYVDDGFAMGKSITDPSTRASNTIGQTRFVAGYSPSFVG